MTRFELPAALGFIAVGAIIGMVYLRALAWNTRLYSESNLGFAFILHALRLASLAVALVLIVRTAGAAALLIAIGGFEAARLPIIGSAAFRIGKMR